MMSGLQRWLFLLTHVSAYDINCQYRIHFKDRMAAFSKFAAALSSIEEKDFPDHLHTIAGIGKFHLPAHCPACQYIFSFNFLPGVGMTDGEAPERIWSSLNALGQRTREMSSGHRHDVINGFYGDMNWQRTQNIRTSRKASRALSP